MFNAFLSPRAAPATPEQCLGASIERPSRSMWPSPGRRVARPPHYFTRLRLSSLPAAARGFAAVGLPTGGIQVPLLLEASRPHAGDRVRTTGQNDTVDTPLYGLPHDQLCPGNDALQKLMAQFR